MLLLLLMMMMMNCAGLSVPRPNPAAGPHLVDASPCNR